MINVGQDADVSDVCWHLLQTLNLLLKTAARKHAEISVTSFELDACSVHVHIHHLHLNSQHNHDSPAPCTIGHCTSTCGFNVINFPQLACRFGYLETQPGKMKSW